MSYKLKLGRFYNNDEILSDEEVLKILNKTKHVTEPVTIDEWFNEWDKCTNELSEKESDLITIKETYNQLEQTIINETDFKALYGKNNETVRKNHVHNELKDIVDNKHDLELRINYLKRRIEYIKELMRMQNTLIYAGVLE